MFYADTVGLPTVLDRVKEYRARFGDYWKPAPLLETTGGRRTRVLSTSEKSDADFARAWRSHDRNPDILALRPRIGQEVAVSDWFEVTQERITQFAEATDDRQWIHVDAERAAEESPYKTTIAHGFLTLSLVSALLRHASFAAERMAINYGLNRVRFITAVPSGSRIRARFVPSG